MRNRGCYKKRLPPSDGRQNLLQLTAAGQAEFAKINERSQEEIGAMLSTVPEADQQRLVDAHHSFGHDLVGETWELDL